MTLCIAAECEYRDKPAIALCADWRAQTGDINQPELMTGSDDASKIREFRNASVLLSGNHTKAVDLATACKTAILEFTYSEFTHEDLDIAVDDFMQKLRQIAVKKKTQIIQDLVQNATGLPHSEFVKLPRDQHPDIWNALLKKNLGADILIAHVSHEAIIVRLDRWGETHWEHNYGVIGDGAEIARAMLCLETWTPSKLHNSGLSSYMRSHVPLEECIFRIDEAHFVAHKANPSSVGQVTSFQVLRPTYRASVRGPFMDKITVHVRAKHQIPVIQAARAKNEILFTCQPYVTGRIQDGEPDE